MIFAYLLSFAVIMVAALPNLLIRVQCLSPEFV